VSLFAAPLRPAELEVFGTPIPRGREALSAYLDQVATGCCAAAEQ